MTLDKTNSTVPGWLAGYMVDLARVADDEPCFFCRMGELARERLGSNG